MRIFYICLFKNLRIEYVTDDVDPGPWLIVDEEVSSPASVNTPLLSTHLPTGNKKPAMTPQFFGHGANLHELANALRSATRTKIPPASSRGHRRVDQFSAEPLADNGYARVLAQSRFAQCLAGQDALPRDPYFSHLKFVPEVLDAGSSWTYFLASPGRQCGTQDVPGVYAAVAAGQNDRLAVMGIFDQRGLPSTTCDSVFWVFTTSSRAMLQLIGRRSCEFLRLTRLKTTHNLRLIEFKE